MQGNSAKREDVQKIILALLVSQKNAIPLAHLDRDYREQEGEYIPWKEFGYISLFDYLKSMPKYVYLERQNGIYYVSGIASDKSKHVSSLVARQKDTLKKSPYTRRTYRPSCYYPKTQPPRIYIPANILSDIIHIVRNNPNGTNKEYILKKVNEKLPRVNISVIDLEEQFKELSHELYVQGNLVFPAKSKTKFMPEQYVSPQILSNVEENLQSQCIASTLKYCISGDSDSELNIDDDDDFAFVSPDSVSNSTNGNNKSTILKKKQPISMFIQQTVSKCHIQGDKFNDTFVHTIKESEYNNVDNKVTLDTPTKTDHQVDITYLDDECAKLLINDRTKLRLEKLIQKYPNGIWCAELPEKFLTEYNRSLNYTELGFNSVREFASYLPEIFQCKQLQPLGDFILYDAKKELIDAQKKDKTKSPNMAQIYSQLYQDEDELEALPFIVSSDTSNKLMPEGVMVIGESVGQISVIDLENRLQPYIEVFVEEVFTPSFFWVQLRKKKKLFNKLMEDLHAFYQEKSSLYKIPLVVLEKGLNCACIYNNQWHRGIIKTVKPDSQVTVIFYDYGTLKTYPPEAIYYLHRSFSYMAAQAIPCGLYNTKPCIGEQWTRGVTHEFAIRTSQRPLIATIVSTDSENNSMLITLTDTMEEEDVHINDWLVLQNLAVHGKMVRIRPRNFPYYYYLECQKYDKTNSEDFEGSKSSITKTDRRSIRSKCLTKNSTPHESRTSSNHVLSAFVNNNSHNKLSSNDPKKDTQYSQESTNNSSQSSNSKGPKELIRLFQRLVNINKLSNSNYEGKPDSTQLHSDTKVICRKNNDSKTELEKIDNLNCTSSSVKSNNPIPVICQNIYLETKSQKQENCGTKMNCKHYVEKEDKNICVQQKEQKQTNISSPKKCFINAVNLSIDSKYYYPDYDTLPDDNITIINDTSILTTKLKNKINFKNIEIGVPEIILSELRSTKSHTNNKCDTNTFQNENGSPSQVQSVTADCQWNSSNGNKTVVTGAQKPSNLTDIHENDNYKLSDGLTTSCNVSKEECILTNIIQQHELINNNTMGSNDNSVSIHDNCSTNLQTKMHRLGTFSTLMKIYNTCNGNSNLDSDDLSNLEECNINISEINKKVLSTTSNMSTDSNNEEVSNVIYNTDTNENNLITVGNQSHSFLKNEDNSLEQAKLDESIFDDVNEEVIPTFNDNDVKSDDDVWDVVGDMRDFFENHFLSNSEMTHMAKNDDEKRVQITEISDNESNKSLTIKKSININSENYTSNSESEVLETKATKNIQNTLLHDLKCVESTERIDTQNNCFTQQTQKDKVVQLKIDTAKDNIVLTDVDNACYKPQGKAKSLELMLHKLSQK